MAKRHFRANDVPVPATLALSFENLSPLQFSNNTLHRALGDSYPGGNIFQSHIRILGDADQNVGVVAQ
jgi:hypothetical protein